MKILYITGNGFDLHHNMRTRYSEFQKYLECNYCDLFEEMSNYYDTSDDSLLWSQFERGLQDFDSSTLEDEFGDHLPDYSSDEFRDRDRYDLQYHITNTLTPFRLQLQEAFNYWIASQEIPQDIERFKIEINEKSLFLNFNYTNTLEAVYKIPRENITYIHNKLGEDKDLLFGHAWKSDEWAKKREPQMPKDLDEEQQQAWIDEQADNYDYSIMRAYEAIDSFFSSIYKDCSSNIAENEDFFCKLVDVTEIRIYGHSLSEVDKPYFQEIIKRIGTKPMKWIVSYYVDSEKTTHTSFLNSIGVKNEQIEYMKL